MTIEPTLEGGLRFLLEAKREWEIFERLISDAEGRGEGWLAKRLGVLMDDEDWDEFVAPELSEQFEGDLAEVRQVLKKALAQRHEADDLDEEPVIGVLEISKEKGGLWYSVFNQARLAMEGRWKLAALDEGGLESPDELEPERLDAYLRSRFYTRVQSLLLDFVMDL